MVKLSNFCVAVVMAAMFSACGGMPQAGDKKDTPYYVEVLNPGRDAIKATCGEASVQVMTLRLVNNTAGELRIGPLTFQVNGNPDVFAGRAVSIWLGADGTHSQSGQIWFSGPDSFASIAPTVGRDGWGNASPLIIAGQSEARLYLTATIAECFPLGPLGFTEEKVSVLYLQSEAVDQWSGDHYIDSSRGPSATIVVAASMGKV